MALSEFIQNWEAGGQAGRAQRTRRTLSEYMQPALGGDQGAQQAIYNEDPDIGFRVQDQAQQLGKSARDDFGEFSRLYASAPEPMQKQMYPGWRQRAIKAGLPAELPEAYDPQSVQVAQAAARAGLGGSVQSTYIDAQGNRVAIMRDGKTSVLGQNAPNNQIIDTGNGFYGVNKGNLSAAPVTVGGAPQAPPQGIGPGTYQTPSGIVRIGDLPPEMQQAALADMQAGGTASNVQLPPRNVAPGQSGSQLRSAPKPQAPSDIERRIALAVQMGATPEELRRMVIGGDSARDAQRISAKDATTARQKLTQIKSARQQLTAAREAFDKLKGSYSAGLGGQYLPTAGGQAFDRAIANLAPLLTAVTRVPGIGAMSDYESRLQNAALPSRGTYEDVTVQQFDDLARLFDTVEQGYNELLSGGQAAPTASDESDDIDTLLDLYR